MFFRPSYRADELEDAASAARLKVKRRWLQEAWRVRDEAGGVIEDVPSIADFYRGRHIFVTGGSGFVGKSLVEKLLRMCPDVGAVYMLIRPKKGQTPDDRLQDILRLPVFDRVRKEVPSALDKVFAVRGDCLEDGLGLDEADRRKLIERVSVVFHSAASVRFTEPLKTAVRMNLRPTNDIVQLAREMRQLKVLVHVSTAYSFTNHSPIKECVYETDHDWRDVMKYTDLPDASTLDKLGPKFLGFQPNTYVFTKALAERVMCEAASDLPIVIVRPSIITCSVDEPMVGWIDNMYGFAGFWAAVCKGVWRISYTSRRDIKFDLVPVDAVASMCLGVAWIKGTGQTLSASAGSPEVVNLTVSDLKPGTLDLMQKVLRDNVWNGKVACPGAVRYPDFVVVENKLLALVLVFVYHFMFGVMVDAALLLLNKKPELLAVYRKATFATSALKYFDREFEFDSNNAWHLLARVQPDDRKYFNFILDDRTDDILEVSRQQLLGVCRYALHERIDLARDTRHYTMLWWAEMFWYLILALGALYLLVRRFS